MYFSTIVVGAGAAGLAASYELSSLGEYHILVDAARRPGDTWRYRYEDLRLVTPAKYCSLPGMAISTYRGDRPTKQEYAEYLDEYAQRINATLLMDTEVKSHRYHAGQHELSTSSGSLFARNLIVASGGQSVPVIPRFGGTRLNPAIKQVHSSNVQSIDALRPGPVLVVGAGQAGSDLAYLAASRGHFTYLSGPRTGRVPPWLNGNRFVQSKIYPRRLPEGLAGAYVRHRLRRGSPLIWRTEKDLEQAGVRRIPRTVGVANGWPLIANGQSLGVANVLWCTGFREGHPWLSSAATHPHGGARHTHGISSTLPGLGFVGLPYQLTLRSGFLSGMAEDARYVVDHLLTGEAERLHPSEAYP